SASEIEAYLMKTKFYSSIYISLDTLKYLKKGGRLTPAAALVGSILRIKPVLQIQGEKLDAFKKVHSLTQAKQVMIEAVRNDLRTRFADYVKNGEMQIFVAHTNYYEEAETFKKELTAIFPSIPVTHVDPLSLSVSCHIGPGSLAVAMARCL
ncbi:MAG TPA: DegV family protein, partial [Candidatus Gallimonas intestinigallinarum]|nr:DegV family protein [Candidatus Gallimonas intestinigallinarum]